MAVETIRGITEAAKPAALTQTYSTADRTHAARTAAAMTDNSTGAVSTTIAAGAGIYDICVNFRAAAITGNVDIFAWTPGHKFKILSVDAVCTDAVTTGAKAATLTPKIATVAVTGGVVALSGTYALAAKQAGTAVTAANTGTAAQEVTITASGVTAFVEGGFSVIIRVQNMDTADAIASLVDQTGKNRADALDTAQFVNSLVDDLQLTTLET